MMKKREQANNRYVEHFPVSLPIQYTRGKRKISVPLGIDEDGNVFFQELEGMNFATLLIGDAGAGKSTFLHTAITHIILNYHPDDVELWLADFLLSEFDEYITHPVPHIKYILMDNTPDLIESFFMRIEDELERRQKIFRENEWCNYDQIPTDYYLPKIVVIVDDFSIVSRKLQALYSYTGKDYRKTLEELLCMGRAFGFCLLFTVQSYEDSNSVWALTQFSEKMIGGRLAMQLHRTDELRSFWGNTYDVHQKVSKDLMYDLPRYYIICPKKDMNGAVCYTRLKTLYFDRSKNDHWVKNEWFASLQDTMKRMEVFDSVSINSYVQKYPLIISSDNPVYFSDCIVSFKQDIAAKKDRDSYVEGDAFLYPGIPKNMSLIQSVNLHMSRRENILVLGNQVNDMHTITSMLLSLMKSAKAGNGMSLELWSLTNNSYYRNTSKYWSELPMCKDVADICKRVRELKTMLTSIDIVNGYHLIVIFNLSGIVWDIVNAVENNSGERIEALIYDIKDDMKLLLNIGPKKGYHFLIMERSNQDFESYKIDFNKNFNHLFAFKLSKDDIGFLPNRNRIALLEEHTFLYSCGTTVCTYGPYVHGKK